jgi:hypothetical protein
LFPIQKYLDLTLFLSFLFTTVILFRKLFREAFAFVQSLLLLSARICRCKMRFTFTFTVLALLVVGNCTVLGKRSLSGEATYYGGNVAGGTCSFSTYTLPSGIYGTALSDSNWDNSGECGACITVTGPSGNSITAMVRPPPSQFRTPIDKKHRSWMSVRAVV